MTWHCFRELLYPRGIFLVVTCGWHCWYWWVATDFVFWRLGHKNKNSAPLHPLTPRKYPHPSGGSWGHPWSCLMHLEGAVSARRCPLAWWVLIIAIFSIGVNDGLWENANAVHASQFWVALSLLCGVFREGKGPGRERWRAWSSFWRSQMVTFRPSAEKQNHDTPSGFQNLGDPALPVRCHELVVHTNVVLLSYSGWPVVGNWWSSGRDKIVCVVVSLGHWCIAWHISVVIVCIHACYSHALLLYTC